MIPGSNVIDLVPWSEPDGRIVYVVPTEAFIHTCTALLAEHWRGILTAGLMALPLVLMSGFEVAPKRRKSRQR